MHSPPISASLLGSVCFLFLFFYLFEVWFLFYLILFIFRGSMGGRGWIHAVSVWCFWRCLLQHAHCGPPHPLTSSSSMFLDTLHHPLAPHSICALCLPLTGLQYERAGNGVWLSIWASAQTSMLYCQLKKKRKKKGKVVVFTTHWWGFLWLMYNVSHSWEPLLVTMLKACSIRVSLRGSCF